MFSIIDPIFTFCLPYCSLKDIYSICKVNKYFYEYFWNNSNLWKILLQRDYPHTNRFELDCKEMYMRNYTYKNPILHSVSIFQSNIDIKDIDDFQTWDFPQEYLDVLTLQLPKCARNGDVVIIVEQEGYRGNGHYIINNGRIQGLSWDTNFYSEYYGDLQPYFQIGDNFRPSAWKHFNISPIRWIDMKKYGNEIRNNIVIHDHKNITSYFVGILGVVNIVFTITLDAEYSGETVFNSMQNFLDNKDPYFYGYCDDTIHDNIKYKNSIFYILE